MKKHTTNYINTFIEVSDDCPAAGGEIPPVKGDTKTVANIHFELIGASPYKYTSDDIVFQVYADKNELTKAEYKQAREQFFSKGQPCLRCSPLVKRYGWGIHSNSEGKVALVGRHTNEYDLFLHDKCLKIIKGMRSKK